VHISWLITFSCVGTFLGVVLASMADVSFVATIGWLLTGVSVCLFSWIKQQRSMIIVALLGGLLIGAWRGEIEQSALTSYSPLMGDALALEGTVSEDSDTDKNGYVTLRLKNISIDDKTYSGKVWVSLNVKESSVQRSDIVTIRGNITEGFGTFPASMYRAEVEKIKRPVPGDIALNVRNWFADAVRRAIPEPEASLGVGYLVGQRRNLPEELNTALRIAGLTHIVVASGYNLTILVRLTRRLFAKISKYISMISSVGLILSFIAVTGLSPSMSRAGLVAGLSLAAWYYGRKFHPLVLLSVAIAVTTLSNPSYAWGDVGWQLSFAAFFGVMIVAPLLQSYYFGSKKPGILRQILGETIAAWVCTLPILLYTFGYLSNVAIVANLLILPLVPLAMLLTFIAGVGALSVPVLAIMFGFPASVLLNYMIMVAQTLANLPWATSEVEVTDWHVGGMYGLLIIFVLYLKQVTKLNLRDTNIIE
jgi:competence protein ComEC